MGLTKTNDQQIIQHNEILLGGQKINLRSKQLVYAFISLISKENPMDEIKIDAKNFLAFVNNTNTQKWSDIYALTNDIFENLNKNPILVKKNRSKDFKKINWLSSLSVERGELKARFSADIALYFAYEKNEPYTKILWDISNYKSVHSARLTDLFQKFHRKESGDIEVKFTYEVEELKFFLGVQDKYSKFSDFKRRVLEPARKELEKNDYLPYWFEYSVLRKGKTANKVAFVVNVRSKILMSIIPELKQLKASSNNQTTIFEAAITAELSDNQKKIINTLIAAGLNKSYAHNIVCNLSETQAMAYLALLKYGVNRSLAFTLIEKHCSFGEVIGYEDAYVRHSLEILEKQRLDRIKDHQAGKTNKQITPENKRGGLAKKVFVEQLHFPSFMEKLSSIRNSEWQRPKKQKEEKPSVQSLGDILKNIK